MRKLILATLVLSLLSACGKDEESAAPDPAALAEQRAYEKEIGDWRADRLARLQKADG